MKELRKRLNDMLKWSDRLGSDEITEIKELIKICDDIIGICNFVIENEKN